MDINDIAYKIFLLENLTTDHYAPFPLNKEVFIKYKDVYKEYHNCYEKAILQLRKEKISKLNKLINNDRL